MDPLSQTLAALADPTPPRVEEALIALAAGGHALLEGVPGLAKTLLVSSIAQATTMA